MAWPGSLTSIFIEGAVGTDKVQPAGVDLSIAEVYEASGPGTLKKNEKILPPYTEVKPADNAWLLKPGYYIVRFSEIVEIPLNAIGICLPRSTLLRMGASLHCALWDPGYKGRGYTLMTVHNKHGIMVEKGARIAQMVYISLTARPSKTYSGSYQGEGLGDRPR